MMTERRISLFWAIWWVGIGSLIVVVVLTLSGKWLASSNDDQVCLANEIRPHAEQEFKNVFSAQGSESNRRKQSSDPLAPALQKDREINLITPETRDGARLNYSTYYLQSSLLDRPFGARKKPSAEDEPHWEMIHWDGNPEGIIELPDQVEAQLKLIQKQPMQPEEVVENGARSSEAPVWTGPTSWTIDSAPATADTLTEIQKWWPQFSLNSVMIGQKFPNYRFIFGLEESNIEEPGRGGSFDYQLMGLSVWDVNTKSKLTAAPGMTQIKQVAGSKMVITQAVGSWRPSPVNLVLDLAFGPTDDRVYGEDEIFRQSAETESESGLLLVTACPGRIQQISWHREDEVIWELSHRGDDADRVTLVFLNPSQEGIETWRLEAFDRKGRQLNVTNSGKSGNLFLMEVRVAGPDLGSLKVGYFRKKYRLVWELEQLPGMPAENEGLEDLFETKIPYLMVRNEQDLEVFLETALQLQDLIDKDSKTSPSPRSFPIEFSNVSVREILHHWVRAKRKSDRIGFDPNNYILEIRPPLLESWLNELRKVI